MGREVHQVRIGSEVIGYTAYCNTSDIWLCAVESTPRAVVNERGHGLSRHCESPPGLMRHDPHPVIWVDVYDEWGDEPAPSEFKPSPFLYCATCRALVSPPHDGYVYLEYPEDWLTRVGLAVKP